MKIALCVIMVFMLIVLNIAVLPAYNITNYEIFNDSDGNPIGNPVMDFSQPIQQSANFFVSIGEFFHEMYELFHPVYDPTGFVMQYIYFTPEDPNSTGPGRAAVIYYYDPEFNGDGSMITNDFIRVYAFNGPAEWVSFFNSNPYYIRLGNPNVFGHNFMTEIWTGGKLVGHYENSMAPTPTTTKIEDVFTNIIGFGDRESISIQDMYDYELNWYFIGE